MRKIEKKIKKKKWGKSWKKFKNSVALPTLDTSKNNSVQEYKTFSATKILREISFGRSKISKWPFLTILEAEILYLRKKANSWG